MIRRVFLTDKLFKKYGDWLGEGLAQALFNVWHKGDVFEIQPDIILLDEGQSTQLISGLNVPKIFISNHWEDNADDCVPAHLDWIIASIRAQINAYEKDAELERYIDMAHHNGLLSEEALSAEPANLLVFAEEEDRALLEIQLHGYHNVYDPLTLGNQVEPEGIVIKNDLEKLTQMTFHPEVQGLPIFFWSEDEAKLLKALQAGVDSYIPHLSQAEPRITRKIKQHRSNFLRARQLNSTLDMAAKDSLTGLYNHRCLTTHLPPLLSNLSKTGNRKLAAISFDLDRFKNINDHWGHSIGDSILQNVAQILRDALRAGDNLYRTGGDEFLALIQNVQTLEQSYSLAHHLCSLIDETYFVVGEEVVPITISAGIGFYQRGERAQSLLRRADEALYRAKNLGRNRAA